MEMISLVEIKRNCYVYQGSVYIDDSTIFFLATVKDSIIVDLLGTTITEMGIIVVGNPELLQRTIDKVYEKLNLTPVLVQLEGDNKYV